MKRLTLVLATTLALTIGAILPSFSVAHVGLQKFDVAISGAEGLQAGSHPFALTTYLEANTVETSGGEAPDEAVKDLDLTQMPGFTGIQSSVPRCSTLDFLTPVLGSNDTGCDDSTAVGTVTAAVRIGGQKGFEEAPLYNLEPPPGKVAKLGFWVLEVPTTVEIGVSEAPPYNLTAQTHNISQVLEFYGAEVTLWGSPADPVHDNERGHCYRGDASCPAGIPNEPFLILPRACQGPLKTGWAVDSWQHPGVWFSGFTETHDENNPLGMIGCGKLGFNPTITALPTTKAAQSPTGLDFSLDVQDEGLVNPDGIANSDIKKAVVTLPEGMSTNPSIADGLNVCTEDELRAETALSPPGAGCPAAAKIGSIEVETPLLKGELLKGSLYIAAPYENEFNSLLALYIVIKSPELGVVIKQAARVEPDPTTGRLVTVTEEMPQVPFSHFRLHFREGARSPLASPPTCGSHAVKAQLFPWSGGPPVTTTSVFQIITGPGAGACPTGGVPPFRPGLDAGTLNNAAGHFSPFYLRLSRNDSEQEFTHFSIKMPPGITGKLAGIPFCSDAAIVAARARTGIHGGQEELERPSCPASSKVGRTLVGVGVGPSLAYAPGAVYLAGPYHGSALSIAAITAGKVGPFDLGTVVVRAALRINSETAEVFVDATGSDPIPHIIKGIPVHARDIRVYVDRPGFILNPTSCERTSTASTILGSGLNFGTEADDVPVTVTSPFQAADCGNLGFKPELALSLKGGTHRGDNPALRAVLRPEADDANIRSLSVQLPHSEFLDQAHLNTVCTRVQFNAGAGNGAMCPAGSIYGNARAFTPILADPLEGPVFLRSSANPLPDVVVALHGLVDFNAVGRIDSVDGGIRSTFGSIPDAPITKVVVNFRGREKGLFVNSRSICKSKNRAVVKFIGHNGNRRNTKPVLRAKCGKAHKGKAAQKLKEPFTRRFPASPW